MLGYFYHLGSLKDYLTSFFTAKQITDSKELFPITSVRVCGLFFFLDPQGQEICIRILFSMSWPHTGCAAVVSPVTKRLQDHRIRCLLGPAFGSSLHRRTSTRVKIALMLIAILITVPRAQAAFPQSLPWCCLCLKARI